MARIEGTGIKAPSSKSTRMAMATYRVDPMDKMLRDMDKAFQRLGSQESTGAVKETGRGMGDRFNPFTDRADASDQIDRGGYFSPGGGATDPRNNIQVASANIGTDEGFNQFVKKDFGVGTDSSTYKSFPDHIKGDLRNQYKDSIKFKEGSQINQAPKQEKPSIGERVAKFAGGVVNTLTGTPSAVAATKDAGKNLFNKGIPDGTYGSTERTVPAGSFGISEAGKEKAAENRGKYLSSATGIPSGSNLPAGSFGISEKGKAKAKANKKEAAAKKAAKEKARAKTISRAKKNPNVAIKGGRAVATNKSGKARAQAAAYNRKLSGAKQKSAKQRAQDAAKARRKAGPNRKMSDGQKTRSQAGKSARTAAGNRARVKSNARKRAQAAAKRRRAKKRSRK